MAPSHMENEYTHKKFNCGYSHKKLGMRLVRRDSQEEMQQQQEISNNQMDIETTQERTTSPSLFRPYALDEEQSSEPQNIKNQESTFTQEHSVISPEDLAQYLAQHYSQQQSPDAYALKLQRQRAVLYMKHVMHLYENGSDWPSMHPNALQHQMMAYNTQYHC